MEAMSEFKFACPVCGQHITTDSGSSGKSVECPTCFRQIVVPQAPASEDTKFILSAAQVSAPRPASAAAGGEPLPQPRPSALQIAARAGILAVVLCLAATAFWAVFGNTILTRVAARHASTPAHPTRLYPVPDDIHWTLNLTNAGIPDKPAAGRLNGVGFRCERATLRGGKLTLRQGGPSGAPVAGVSIHLFARRGEELSGKAVDIATNRPPPLPRVSLRWKEDTGPEPGKTDYAAGYALKLAFRKAANGRIAGKIYLCFPDASQSFLAGTFDAEIKKPER